MNIVITSGGFDPIHVGHIEYLAQAKTLSDYTLHICIVNSDAFLIQKKGYAFQTWEDRQKIVGALACVDIVVPAIDTDLTVCRTIEDIHKTYSDRFAGAEGFIFAKGGDRFAGEIPESEVCKRLGIMIVDGLGSKIRASSDIMERAKQNGYR